MFPRVTTTAPVMFPLCWIRTEAAGLDSDGYDGSTMPNAELVNDFWLAAKRKIYSDHIKTNIL